MPAEKTVVIGRCSSGNGGRLKEKRKKTLSVAGLYITTDRNYEKMKRSDEREGCQGLTLDRTLDR